MFLQVTFHELGHGMFDIYNIPVLGREEDAADQMAGFILSQFGPDIARRTLPAGAYVWQKLYEAGGDWPRWALLRRARPRPAALLQLSLHGLWQ